MHKLPSTITLLLAFALLGAPSSTSRAQEDQFLPLQQDAQAAVAQAEVITNKAVDVLTRSVIMRLRNTRNPAQADFRAAALAIRIIRRLAPDDIELLRHEIEAWTTAGDEEQALAATRQLLRVHPQDEVAQIRATLAGMRRLNDVDARLKAYDRLLGPKGGAIDPAVRSRLAFDAALLARDNADESRFLEYLAASTTLDPSNKEAAATFGTHVLGRTDDPLTRVDVLQNIILADPLDPGAYENLGLELLRHGAYAGALRALRLATGLTVAAGGAMSPQRLFDFALCESRRLGPEAASARIYNVLRDSRLAEERRQERDDALGLAVTKVAVYLPPELDMLRLSIVVASNEEQSITLVIDSFLAGNNAQFEQLRAVEATDLTPEQEREIHISKQILRLQRLWALLFAGVRIDEAELLLQEIIADSASDGQEEPAGEALRNLPPLDDAVLQRFNGWLAMNKGQDVLAEQLLTPLVEFDQNARWAMGVLREQQGNTREAMLHFAHLAKDNPRSAMGSASWYRLIALRGNPLTPSKITRQLEESATTFAPWLDTFASDPSSFMSLDVRHVATDVGPLGSIRVRVTVRNTSLWPLGVGAARPIPKRVLLAPRLRLNAQNATKLIDPVVVLIPDRLRLEPAEEATVIVTPSRELLGVVLDAAPTARASLRWQAVQGFVTAGESEGYIPGSLTVTTLSDIVIRDNLDGSITTDELIARIGIRSGAPLLSDINVARRRVIDSLDKESGGDPGDANRLVNAIVERLPAMTGLETAITLLWFGETNLAAEDAYGPMLRQGVSSDDSYVALALLLRLIRDADDPHLQAMVSSTDDDLSRLAYLLREDLRARQEP